LNAAYNYPARIQTRCPWDIFADASFIYWQPIQENLEIGIANTLPASGAGVLTTGVNGNVINMDFNYKPGFKVGFGGNFDYDGWDLRLEYTWFHNTNSQSSNGPTGGNILPMFGHPDLMTSISTFGIYDTASANWNLKMDIIDLDLGRWHYVGTKLVCHPVFGVRADWIRQKLSAGYTRAASGDSITADVAAVSQKSASWAIGPKIGMDSNYDLGMGFRFFGNGEADLLFTKYTRLSFSETHTDAALILTPITVKQSRTYAVKPHLDLELGFGWGTYLDCNNWYMDFALGYEFQVFFDQNMFRHFTDDVMIGNSNLPNGNLYLQGLTATFKLDF
jgi:hypothetical protein